jgi:hypothetical protein
MNQKQQGQFITFTEQDSEGADAGIVAINRHQVIGFGYSAINNTMIVTTTAISGKSGVVNETESEPEPASVNGKEVFYVNRYHGIESITQSERIVIREPKNIVKVWNFLTNENYSDKSFPGFKMNEAQKQKIQTALDRKRVDDEQKQKEQEEAEAQKRKDLISNPNLDATTDAGAKIITPSF